jgi:tRNA pseudouridine55 synthase
VSSSSFSGLVLLDKPAGVTSCKALFPLRKVFRTKRVGHAGSLDMRASGLIVAAVGRATRLLPFVESAEKSYTFYAHFGYSTETDEWDGALLEEDPSRESISEEAVQKILPNFIGELEQVPPGFSAVKLNGRRASDLVRKGHSVELKARKIFIRNLKFEGVGEVPENATGHIRASYRFSCDCSKGTYIRSLVRDMAKALGTCGAVSAICRTRIGHLTLDEAVKPENLSETSLLKPQNCMGFPVVKLTDRQVSAFRNGRAITWNASVEALKSDVILATDRSGELKAACFFAGGMLAPKFYLGTEDA